MNPASRDCPGRLVSLWDIMNTFNVFHLAALVSVLDIREELIRNSAKERGGGESFSPEYTEDIKKSIEEVEQYCNKVGFNECATIAQSSAHFIQLHLASQELIKQLDMSTLQAELRHVREGLMRDASERKFLRVALKHYDYVDQDALFGADVYDAFQSARQDIREAGNCLAADCNTAAVFHMMRAVEWGLRAFCRDVGLNRIFKELDKATGKRTYIPIEYATWDKILGQLHGAIKTKVSTLKRSRDKQKAQEFYYGVHQEVEGLKDAFRNHVMHARREYTAHDADAIFDHVKRVMTMLATRGRKRG